VAYNYVYCDIGATVEEIEDAIGGGVKVSFACTPPVGVQTDTALTELQLEALTALMESKGLKFHHQEEIP
jgi:hypothetical protein